MGTSKIEGQPRNLWTSTGRGIVFILAATSIACLLSEFYRLCPMREFTLFIFLPALAGLAADRTIQRDTRDNKPFGPKSTIDMKLVGQGSHDRNGSS
jgi:hypothetical protein